MPLNVLKCSPMCRNSFSLDCSDSDGGRPTLKEIEKGYRLGFFLQEHFCCMYCTYNNAICENTVQISQRVKSQAIERSQFTFFGTGMFFENKTQ